MAKIKRISASALERAVKKNFDNVITDEWCGLNITITPTISLQDVFSLAAEVSTNCFSEDGQYVPEAMNALLSCGIVERYTNIDLPEDVTAKYELVMKSGLIDFVMARINEMQYTQIVEAIRDKVDYACDSKVAELSHSISQIMESIYALRKNAERMIGNFDIEDIRKVISALSGDHKIEDAVVSEYINK